GGDVLRAHRITLAADGDGGASDGSITIAGRLDASGSSGGRVGVFAHNNVVLGPGGAIDAHVVDNGGNSTEPGGQVTLSGRITNDPLASRTLDAVSLDAASTVNVGGGSQGSGGSVTLRGGRIGNDVAVAPFAPNTITGARKTIVEGVTLIEQAGDV